MEGSTVDLWTASAQTLTHDPVDHPLYYTSHPSGVECIEIIEHHSLCIGNAIKYLWRAGLKNQSTLVEDLKKAVWYIEREIRRVEGQEGKGQGAKANECNQ